MGDCIKLIKQQREKTTPSRWNGQRQGKMQGQEKSTDGDVNFNEENMQTISQQQGLEVGLPDKIQDAQLIRISGKQ